jgi:acetoin:2,6-dichlorophenolindophenol oxidoreductase subunit beta
VPKIMKMGEAINRTLREEMARNKDVITLGIDVRGGVYGFTSGLVDEFGKERVINTPIAESAIVGTGVGAALMGLRPVAKVMMEDFAMIAMDHLYNNMGTIHYMSNGQYSVPLVVLLVSGSGSGMGAGPGHGQCLQPIWMSIPGVSVCVPATPYDARGLLLTALRANDPVIFSVHSVLVFTAEGEIPDEEYTIPFGQAKVVRSGTDVTLVAVSGMVPEAEASAEELAKEGISVEVIDPRTLAPLDESTIVESVAKTGRLVVAEESRGMCGVGAEVIARVAAQDPMLLKAPARRVSAPPIPIPAAAEMEAWYLPHREDITRSIREIML